jgi:hypothetical protein
MPLGLNNNNKKKKKLLGNDIQALEVKANKFA